MTRGFALITGASSGIGAATARALAAEGYSLILMARRAQKLDHISQEILSQHKVKVECVALDVCDRPALLQWSQKTDLKRITLLVNNAGLAKGTDKLAAGDFADWDAMIDTNIKALLTLTRLVLPAMKQNDRGHVINIGSVAGRWVYPGGAVYCATKFAVRAISEGLRMDLMGTALRVTNIEPGMVETEFSEVRFNDKEKAKAVYQGMTPLSGEDVAEAVLWCASRPPHVNVQELVLFPTDQASVGQVQRR